ncbi:MAG: hypothetical protein DSM106950_24400 [Stigonema ocellatum SAG 48.90 = DSM 106950]|nr:hypothetical protein [Stigonema ocellatum SAG 48.90 = DSM 106950]
MTFLLSSKNVFEYLIGKDICTQEEQDLGKIELRSAKNFNLLLTLPHDRKLLVKQEPRNREGKTVGEFLREWRIQEFLQQFPEELSHMRSWLSEGIYFNAEDSLIVFNYLDNYRDLMEFYGKENIFTPEIATTIGTIIAKIHRLTLDRQDYQDFFQVQPENQSPEPKAELVKNIERIGPEIL